MMKEPRLTICGVMSGSSMDGLDMAICQFDQDSEENINWYIQESITAQFPDQLIKDILDAYTSSSSFIYQVEQQFSEFCAKALNSFVGNHTVDYVAFHGHTIFHEPQKGYTTQIGNAHHISQRLDIPVIAQFRNKDVSLGGQGAPLAPIVEKYLFKDYSAFLNLGGIVNISLHNENIVAYDITACNQALNHLSTLHYNKKFDENGDIASIGKLDEKLLEKLNQLEFLNQKPPKSLSNTWVQNKFNPILDKHESSPEDKMNTVVQHIAKQVASCCQSLDNGSTVLASGGGVHNVYMMERISHELKSKGISLKQPSHQISEFKEALLMALMGYLRVNEQPNCIASVTGASRDSVGGTIYHPDL